MVSSLDRPVPLVDPSIPVALAPLTECQWVIFTFILRWRSVHGASPSLRQIARYSGRTPRDHKTIWYHLQEIRKRGWLWQDERGRWIPTAEARAMRILPRIIEYVGDQAEAGCPEAAKLLDLMRDEVASEM